MPRLNKGFTLIELIITIGVVAILLAIAVPSMRDFVIDIRVASNVRLFLAANRFARSEAIKRGYGAAVCAATGYDISDLERCRLLGGTGFTALSSKEKLNDHIMDESFELNWSEGWIVLSGSDTDGMLLRHSLKSNSMTTIVGSEPLVLYTGKGALSPRNFNTGRLREVGVLFSPGTKFARRVCISVNGLAQVVRKTGAGDPVC